MPGAVIVADQPSGAGSGVPGTARDDLWLSRQINLSVGTAGNQSYSWELLDKPPGSASVLSTPTLSTCSFTPDLVGTYRIRLVTNGGGAGNIQILVLRVRYTNTGELADRGWALPGLGESGTSENNYGDNTRGYDEVFRYIFADLLPWAHGLTVRKNGVIVGQQREIDFIGDGFSLANDGDTERIRLTLRPYIEIPLFAGMKATTSETGEVLAARALDFSVLPPGTKQIHLVATLQSGDSDVVAVLELWNVTRGYMVASSQLNNSEAVNRTLFTTIVSTSLTLGTSSGDLRSDSADEYDLRMYVAEGTGVEDVTCGNCHIRVTYGTIED